MGVTRVRVSGLLLAAVLSLAGCTDVPGVGAEPPDTSSSTGAAESPAVPTPSATSSAAPPTTPIRNDLKAGTLKHDVRVAGLNVNVEYATPLNVARWTPDVNKPLNVRLTVSGKGAQKVYLTRVRVNVGVSDGSGALESPEPLVDEATISPGFIVTRPNTYGQVFVIPAVDSSARALTLDVTYEFLLQVAPNSRDFSKQSARDSVAVALA